MEQNVILKFCSDICELKEISEVKDKNKIHLLGMNFEGLNIKLC